MIPARRRLPAPGISAFLAAAALAVLSSSHPAAAQPPDGVGVGKGGGVGRTGLIKPHPSQNDGDGGGDERRGPPNRVATRLDLSGLLGPDGRAEKTLPGIDTIEAILEAGGQAQSFRRKAGGPNDDAEFFHGEADGGVPDDLQFRCNGNYCAGSATIGGTTYMILNGTAIKLKDEDLPDEGSDVAEVAVAEPARKLLRQAAREGHLSPNENERDGGGRNLEGGVSYIDVLVPYTKRAMCSTLFNDYTKGPNECLDTDANRVPIETIIDGAINGANEYLVNSGVVGKQFRLLGTMLVASSYDELNPLRSWLDVLKDVRYGRTPGTANARAASGADLVHLVIGCKYNEPTGYASGYAYDGPATLGLSYSVSCWHAALAKKTLAHELGHQMGCKHDAPTECGASTCSGTNYAYGKNPNTNTNPTTPGWYTLVGIKTPSGSNPSNRIGYYSNPNVDKDGDSTGTVNHNNAAVIDSNWATISNIAVEVAPTISPRPTPSPTPRPTRPPTPAPTKVNTGGSCVDGLECASGSCSGGAKSKRVCLAPPPSPATSLPATPVPTATPTKNPTSPPTAGPTKGPSDAPATAGPTKSPSTPAPTSGPSKVPTDQPATSGPTSGPTKGPTDQPSTKGPTGSPSTAAPTSGPTKGPTGSPSTFAPTSGPTKGPTDQPATKVPTGSPSTSAPTSGPTKGPTDSPVPAQTQDCTGKILSGEPCSGGGCNDCCSGVFTGGGKVGKVCS